MQAHHPRITHQLERSAGAVIYRRRNGQVFFLLLKYPGGYWEFPRGHLEKGETIREAAHREIQEEVGLSGLLFLPHFHELGQWTFTSSTKGYVSKTVHYFLAKVNGQSVHISNEHVTYRWVTLEQSKRLHMWPNARTVLTKAARCVSRHDRRK